MIVRNTSFRRTIGFLGKVHTQKTTKCIYVPKKPLESYTNESNASYSILERRFSYIVYPSVMTPRNTYLEEQ